MLQWVTWHRNISWRVKGVRGWWCQNIRVCNKRHPYLTWRELQVYPFQARALSSVSYFLQASAMLQRGSNRFLWGNQPGQELKWFVCIWSTPSVSQNFIRSVPFALEIMELHLDALLLHCQLHQLNLHAAKNRKLLVLKFGSKPGRKQQEAAKNLKGPFFNSHQRTRLSYCGGVTSANHLSCDS